MRTSLLVVSLWCAACAVDPPAPIDDAGTAVPSRDVVGGAYLWDATTDGHLVFRQWSGQGLELWVHHVATGVSTRLDSSIEPNTLVVVSGGVVAWWSGPNSDMSYWSAASGVRMNAGGGARVYWIVGSHDGRYVAYVRGCAREETCEVVFGPTVAPTLLVAPISLTFPNSIGGRIGDDGELVLLASNVGGARQLRHVRDGTLAFDKGTDIFSFNVDADMTHALLWGPTLTLYDLATEQMIDLGTGARHIEMAGVGSASSALFVVDGQAGIERVRLFDHARTTIASDLVVHGIRAGRGNDLFVIDKSGTQWLLDLQNDTRHVIGSSWGFVQPTESGAWMVQSKEDAVQRYPEHSSITYLSTVTPLDRDGTALQSLTHALPVAPSWRGTVGDNVVAWRNAGCPECGDLDYELWYMSPAQGTSGRIARGFAWGSQWPETPSLGSAVRAIGHEVFYTEETEDGPILRGATLP